MRNAAESARVWWWVVLAGAALGLAWSLVGRQLWFDAGGHAALEFIGVAIRCVPAVAMAAIVWTYRREAPPRVLVAACAVVVLYWLGVAGELVMAWSFQFAVAFPYARAASFAAIGLWLARSVALAATAVLAVRATTAPPRGRRLSSLFAVSEVAYGLAFAAGSGAVAAGVGPFDDGSAVVFLSFQVALLCWLASVGLGVALLIRQRVFSRGGGLSYRREGCCGACGYELRGLPAGAVCPECGVKTGAPSAPAGAG